MSYAKTQAGAKKRVKVKHELRRLGCTGWKNNDSMKKLKSKLKECKR